MRRRLPLLIGAAVLAAGALSLWPGLRPPAARDVREADAPGAAQAAVLPVEVRAVERQAGYAVREVYAGRVVARRESVLGFERGGRLEAVAVDEGDRVEAGQGLARLDVRELEARRAELAAQVDEIGARLALARLTTERRRRLHADEALSDQALDEAVYEQRALAARLAAARAGLRSVEVQLELSVLPAPFAGLVVERRADEGAVVSPGQPILRVIEDGALEVHVGVAPDAAAALAVGERRRVRLGGREVPARVAAVVGTVEADTRTVPVILRLLESPPEARPGALARLPLEDTVDAEGFWLPVTALAESRRGLWSAYALVSGEDEGEGTGSDVFRVERRQVELIHAEADRAFVRGTLRDGERVVATGVHRLVPGQRVRPAGAGPVADAADPEAAE